MYIVASTMAVMKKVVLARENNGVYDVWPLHGAAP